MSLWVWVALLDAVDECFSLKVMPMSQYAIWFVMAWLCGLLVPCPHDVVPAAPQITAAVSNSFGFGGHNSCVVFAPFKA